MPVTRRVTTLVAGLTLLLAAAAGAADWPQYRGPNFDGSSPETLRTNWTARPPVEVWRKTLAPGWSSPVVAGGRLFTQVRRNGQEHCLALDAGTGAELWARPVDDARYDNLAGYDDNIDGPRSTPSVDGDRVYVFTSHLKLHCLRADNGAVVWSRDFVAEFPGTSVIGWQNAASPLVAGDRIYVNSNVGSQRLAAIRKHDGTTAWARHNDGMTHTTPAWAVIGGVPQAVFVTSQGMVAVAPDSGDVLWRYTFSPSGTSTAASPIVAGDRVYASAAYGRGAWNARIVNNSGAFSATQTQYLQATEFQNHWATPVPHEGVLYGIVERSSRSLVCFDLAGRTNRWRTSTVGSGNPGFGSVIKVGGMILVLTEDGELVLVQPDLDRYVERARYQALTAHCWNNPAFSNGRLYARSSSEMVALDLAPETQPLPPLEVSGELSPGSLRLIVGGAAGEPLTAVDAARVEVQKTAAFIPGTTAWQPQTVAWTATNGVLETTLPTGTGTEFFRVRAQP